ncbi:MAG: MBL fold metallo-hydrolase [Dehalococcoidia bacterium]
MERIEDGDLILYTAGPVGFGNNIYLIVDRTTDEAAFIDAPGDAAENAAIAEAAGVRPAAILLTHSHPDHTPAIDGLKAIYGCRVWADKREPWLKPGQLDHEVEHEAEVRVGNLRLRALSVPGHTPGSTTFVLGKHAFVGDTLFPGGPGNSRSSVLLQQEIASITTHLYALPDETRIWPGHGANTTIGASKAEYAVFASKPHDPDLHGDVAWLTS